MAFPFLNQVYAGLNPNDATVNQWVANVNAAPKPVVDGTLPPGAIVMPGQPVNVNAPALAGVPAQFQAQPAPVRVPAPPPQVPQPAPQMAANAPAPQAQGPQTQDLSVGLSAAPIQYGVINSPGRAAGELNTMGPNQERFAGQAASTIGNAETSAAERVATAMVAQQAPLDERAQYLTALAQREAQDQTGRNEQNRQRIEDYEREAQAFRDMKVDPDSAVSDRQKAALGIGGFVTALMDAFTSGRTNTHGAIREAFQESKAQGIQAQQQNITNRRAYLDSVRNAMQAQREMQGDQVASTQRQAQLMKEATGAHLDQAGIGVAMSEALARGDLAQAQALSKLYQQQAAAQRYIPASGGSQMMWYRDPETGVMMQGSRKEIQSAILERSKDIRGAGLGIARDAAKADAEGKGKKEEDFIKRWVPSPTGGPGQLYPTEAEAKKAREGFQAAAKALETMDKAKALTNEMGVAGRAWDKVVPGGSAKGEQLRSLQGQAILALKDSENMGTLDTQAERMGQKVTGDFTKLFNPTATMDAYRQSVWDQLKRQERYNAGSVRPDIGTAAPSFKPVGK